MRLPLASTLVLLGLLTACDEANDEDRSAAGGAAAGGGAAGAPAGGTSAGGHGTGTAGAGAVTASGGTGGGEAGMGGAGAAGVILPDFTMVDINPASPTFEQARSLSDANGKVLMLYMVQFT
jgi:hypothetical protein